MFSTRFLLCLVCLAVGLSTCLAALGGGACTIPPSGSPGASSQCTGTANGFCLIDHLSVTGSNPVLAVTNDGICICYYGYTGPQCATAVSTSTTTSTNNNNAIAALVLGGLAAYALANTGVGTGLGAGATSANLNEQDILYLQQAGLG